MWLVTGWQYEQDRVLADGAVGTKYPSTAAQSPYAASTQRRYRPPTIFVLVWCNSPAAYTNNITSWKILICVSLHETKDWHRMARRLWLICRKACPYLKVNSSRKWCRGAVGSVRTQPTGCTVHPMSHNSIILKIFMVIVFPFGFSWCWNVFYLLACYISLSWTT